MGQVQKHMQIPENGHGQADFQNFIGASPAMQDVYRLISQAAPSNATIFITGESGTGKELCAEAIHALSRNRKGKLVAINSSAIPRDLMESEIFGHVRGAFTGATSDNDGAALTADGGTLFLDEICDMDLDLQAKLLRFIQTGKVRKVGSHEMRQVDVRIICATNKNPLEEVRAGRFREDLYYRLHVVPIHIPPLRERGNDITEIANIFLCRFSTEENKSFSALSADAARMLRNYFWPGNVRELENVIYNIVVMNTGFLVNARMLPLALARSQREKGAKPEKAVSALTQMLRPQGPEEKKSLSGNEDDIRPLWTEEKKIIERAISICGGNINQAAAKLGVNPSTIYRKKLDWAKRSAA